MSTDVNISVEMILEGLLHNYVQLVLNPVTDLGTVCQIGEHWFYFGGEFADAAIPIKYLAEIPLGTIATEIYESLNEMKNSCETEDEYVYYAYYLSERKSVLTKRQFYIDTPLGKLKVYAKAETDTSEEFPGVYIDLVTDEFPEGDMVACVEYDSDFRRLQACVYADRTQDLPPDVMEIGVEGEEE